MRRGLAIFPASSATTTRGTPRSRTSAMPSASPCRATNGYVYPASHRAGSTSGALPMGARLRLKTNVGGQDPALRTTRPERAEDLPRDAEVRRSSSPTTAPTCTSPARSTRVGTTTSSNPAFSTLARATSRSLRSAGDPCRPRLRSPASAPIRTQSSAATRLSGTVTLTSAAPSGGAVVSLSSANGAVSRPGSDFGGNGRDFSDLRYHDIGREHAA